VKQIPQNLYNMESGGAGGARKDEPLLKKAYNRAKNTSLFYGRRGNAGSEDYKYVLVKELSKKIGQTIAHEQIDWEQFGEEIPEEFLCVLMGSVMEEPVRCPTPHCNVVMDKQFVSELIMSQNKCCYCQTPGL
jgi:hypothetical protein